MSKTIGWRSTANASCGSRTATVWRTAPAGIRMPGQPADRAEARAAGQDHALRRDRAGVRLDADDPPAAAGARLGPEAREGRPLAELDARLLHRERVGPDVAGRVDVAVGLEIAAAAMAARARASG